MDFVLVDDSVVTAYTERVSRIARGAGKLQEKMNNVFNKVLGDDYEKFDRSTTAQTVDYSEPVSDVGYDNHSIEENHSIDDFDLSNKEVPSHYDEVGQSVDTNFNEASHQSFEEPMQESSQDLEGDLDIDLDAMLEGISFDEDELQL